MKDVSDCTGFPGAQCPTVILQPFLKALSIPMTRDMKAQSSWQSFEMASVAKVSFIYAIWKQKI